MAGGGKRAIFRGGHGGGGRGRQRLMAKAGGKLHWMKFFPGDWIAGTRGLSSAAKGLWIALLCFCFDNARARGTLKMDLRSMARRCGLSVPRLRRGLKALVRRHLAKVSIRGSQVAVVCRRMVREEQERRGRKYRQRKHRNTKSATRNPRPAVTPLLQTGDQEANRPGDQKPVSTTGALAGAPSEALPPADAPLRSAAPPAGLADAGSCLKNLSGGANNSGPPGAGAAASECPANGPPGEPAGAMAPFPEAPPGAKRPLFPPGWPPSPENQPSPAIWAMARKLHIPPAVLAAEIESGGRPAFAVAWLLVADRHAPHDPKCGGALAFFLAHCKGAAEPPQWALLQAAVNLRLQKLLTVPRAELRAKLLENSPHAAVTA